MKRYKLTKPWMGHQRGTILQVPNNIAKWIIQDKAGKLINQQKKESK